MDDRQCFQIDERDLITPPHCNVGFGSIRRHQNSFRHAAKPYALNFVARMDVQRNEVATFQIGDEDELSVWTEFQTVRPLRIELNGLNHVVRHNAYDRDISVA